MLTKQERLALLFLAGVITAGSGINYTFKLYPGLKDFVNVIDGNGLYAKVNINTAAKHELTTVSYIGDFTAEAIIRRRKIKAFEIVEEILTIEGIREGNYKKFAPYLTTGAKR